MCWMNELKGSLIQQAADKSDTKDLIRTGKKGDIIYLPL